MIKTVIHVHTHYSADSNLSPRELLRAAEREGVACVAVTDHDEVDGAIEARDLALSRGRPVRVIVGEEVSTTAGHVIGLFLRERIRPGRGPRWTIDAIREQGGVVLAPHPFATFCRHSLGREILPLLRDLDAIEVLNAQNPLPWQDARAARLARRHGIATYVGADAHLRGWPAPAYQWLPDFDDAASFVSALRTAEHRRGRYGVTHGLTMAYQHIWRGLVGRPPRGFGTGLRRLSETRTLEEPGELTPEPIAVPVRRWRRRARR